MQQDPTFKEEDSDSDDFIVSDNDFSDYEGNTDLQKHCMIFIMTLTRLVVNIIIIKEIQACSKYYYLLLS